MSIKEMKKLYTRGEWIAVWLHPISKIWSINDQDNRFYRFLDSTKLIHKKKHADVLDHVLNGHDVAVTIGKTTDIISPADFFSTYHETSIYEIIKDKQAEHLCMGEHWTKVVEPKQVERITREDIYEELECSNATFTHEDTWILKDEVYTTVNKLLDIIEHLEANQKEI